MDHTRPPSDGPCGFSAALSSASLPGVLTFGVSRRPFAGSRSEWAPGSGRQDCEEGAEHQERAPAAVIPPCNRRPTASASAAVHHATSTPATTTEAPNQAR